MIRDLRTQECPPSESRHAYCRRSRPIVRTGSGIGTTCDDEARSEFETRESQPAISYITIDVCVYFAKKNAVR